jgi:sec-independent protein translocase protein TatA
MFGLGPSEIAAVLALVVILVLAPKKLPELGSGIGRAITNFKKSYKEGTAIDVTPKAGEDEKEEGEDAQHKDSEKK